MASRNLLICVSGLTPQIVTETFFCLSVKQKIPIHEIYVLTTKRGKDVILARDKHPSTPKTPLKDEIENLSKKYKIHKPLFEENDSHIIVAREESVEFSDIRTDKQNILFPNKICEFLKLKSAHPENVLYCSITGGRKSMSVHLANSLSLFARENDKLLHVLTKEEHEFKGFFPSTKAEADALELSELPFVRLRPIISHELHKDELLKSNFDKIVEYTQTQLKVLAPSNKLIIDVERGELRYANDILTLEPAEFLFYYFFVDAKERGRAKISVYEFISHETKLKFIGYYKEHYPQRDIESKTWFTKGFNKTDFRSKRSKVNGKIKELIKDADVSEQFIINVDREYADSIYYIKADKSRIIIK